MAVADLKAGEPRVVSIALFKGDGGPAIITGAQEILWQLAPMRPYPTAAVITKRLTAGEVTFSTPAEGEPTTVRVRLEAGDTARLAGVYRAELEVTAASGNRASVMFEGRAWHSLTIEADLIVA